MSEFDTALQATLDLAFKKAKEKRHKFFTVEHLTLELLENPTVLELLRGLPDVDLEKLRQTFTQFLETTTPLDIETQPTVSVKRVLQRALFKAASESRQVVRGLDVLMAIYGEKVSKSVEFLKQAGLTLEKLKQLIDYQQAVQGVAGERKTEIAQAMALKDEGQGTEGTGESFLVNLNQKVAAKKTMMIGRENEILQVIQILSRHQKNNPLLVGEPGVGKTAIAEGLAVRINERKVPQILVGSTVFALDITALMAGTQYRGEFERRVQSMLNELRHTPHSILFIDEIHLIVGAGAVSGSSMDLANLLKPILTAGEFKCMGATTYEEYRRLFEKDAAMARRFQVVDIPEPTPEQTVQILMGLKSRLEKHYQIKYTDEAVQSAVDFSVRYIPNRFLPDKAIDILDQAGATYLLLPPAEKGNMVDKSIVAKTISKMVKIPEIEISATTKATLQNLNQALKAVIYGQDQAVDAVADAVKLSTSGLREEDKPIGSFLFVGPTGTGKTELAKQLARLLHSKLLRFDMSEYREPHTVARLIGAPPGYVGYDRGGLLTEEINKNPNCVLLLDEIEKAHPDIYNLLLQIMDHGTLTDSSGRKADFRHSIIIMTTNVGAEALSRPSIGFTTEDHTSDTFVELKSTFSPEFRNRLDAIIYFQALSSTVIADVVNKVLQELIDQLRSKKIILEVDESARLWLAEHGYDKLMGARPMKRLVQDQLKKTLADEMLFGRLTQGGTVHVSALEQGLQLTIL